MSPHGLLLRFEKPDQLISAACAARNAGYVRIDAYSPAPIDKIDEAIGLKPSPLPWMVLAGGVVGAVAGYLLQYLTMVVDYPIVTGGKPFHSWPAFVPVTFECTILGASLAAVAGLFILCDFPSPYHPVFNIEEFDRATRDRFFLCIETTDSQFPETKRFLETLNPDQIWELPIRPTENGLETPG